VKAFLLFNRDIFRRARRCRRECSLKSAPVRFLKLFLMVEHCAVHAVLDQLSAGVAVLDRKLKV
jgi:hypothetical protein